MQTAAINAAKTLLANSGEPSGIIAGNDHGALAFMEAARTLGKVAGRDYGLIGFDDLPQSRSAGLTTLRPPVESMGEEAARLVLRWMGGDRTETQVRLRSHLIARTSTCGTL